MHTVLITGGTGLVGEALSNALLLRGYKVIILSRGASTEMAPENLSYASWDVKKQQIDIAAIQSADYIIHLAGAGVVAKKWTNDYKKEIVESRTESGRLICETLKNNSIKVKAVVSASAVGWYGADTEPAIPFTEDNTADESFLGQTCKLWEAHIAPVAELGIRLVKLRIGIVLSDKGGALTEFKKPLGFGLAAILGNGKQMVSWIHIADLCRMFIAAIENEAMAGSYNAVAPNPVSNRALTLTLAKAKNGKYYVPFHVPAFVLKLIMGDRSIEVLKSTTVSCKKIMNAGFKFNFSDIQNALSDLTKNKRSGF
jgi:uncharacterized protein (TIGR01777 family)